MQLIVYTRRFFCDTPQCQRRIFAEPFLEILPPHARQTQRLRTTLLELAHASSAEMAARVAKLLGFPTSADTLIRRQRQEHFILPSPRALGVDEFALRRGSTYATLIVDLERHRPVDVVEDRKAEPVAHWLSAHPDVKVLARDRAGAYALAGRTGAPNALQVADRFHLVRNVNDALKELARSRRWSLPEEVPMHRDSPPAELPSCPIAIAEAPEPQPTPIKRELWEAVQKGKEKGGAIKGIARELGMDHRTVRKYLALDRPPVYGRRRPRATKLTRYLSYLQERWGQGVHNMQQLHDELVQRGYDGSWGRVYAAVHAWRSAPSPAPPKPSSPLHWLVVCPPKRLTPSEAEKLKQILKANPPLALGYRLKESFHQLVADHNVIELGRWVDQAAQSDLPTFKTLARSLRQDYEAVKAALILPWSTAQCEGQNTRVKLIKRLGYGRAKLDLLRQRILHRLAAS